MLSLSFDKKIKTFNAKTLCDIVNFAFSLKVFGIHITPQQLKEEIKILLELLAKHKPKYILEIGTANGGTLFCFCQVAHPEATIISIDLPNGYPGWRVPLCAAFAHKKQKIVLIRSNSHSLFSLEKIKSRLGNEKLDFLFIDGDHSYEGVKTDFEMYSPLVKRGGIIAFHDIVPDPQNVRGVPVFFKELKHRFNHMEIVKNWKQGANGIGVIFI